MIPLKSEFIACVDTDATGDLTVVDIAVDCWDSDIFHRIVVWRRANVDITACILGLVYLD